MTKDECKVALLIGGAVRHDTESFAIRTQQKGVRYVTHVLDGMSSYHDINKYWIERSHPCYNTGWEIVQ